MLVNQPATQHAARLQTFFALGTIVVILGVMSWDAFFRTVPSTHAAVPLSDALSVTVDDLAAAGFTHPTLQPPQGDFFHVAGVSYFRVQESVAATHPEWGTTANLVAVSIEPIPSAQALTNGQDVINDYDGRISICNTRIGYYFCVIGPDQAKGQALINLLQAKNLE